MSIQRVHVDVDKRTHQSLSEPSSSNIAGWFHIVRSLIKQGNQLSIRIRSLITFCFSLFNVVLKSVVDFVDFTKLLCWFTGGSCR